MAGTSLQAQPMVVELTKRSFLAMAAAALAGGCVERSEEDQTTTPANSSDPSGDNQTASNEESDTDMTGDNSDSDSTDQGEEVPEGLPLFEPLPSVVEASDPAAAAAEHDVEYSDGRVLVEVELNPDGDRPDRYLAEVTDTYADVVVAWVAVGNLVALAGDENVHLVRTKTDPEPAGNIR